MTHKMEEVDRIIVHTLRSIGIDIENEVDSLHHFHTELIVAATARCLKLINSSLQLPNSLPPGMSARFRVGTSLANALTDLGYKGEIGYQTFLYSNEADIRRVFMFLIEKLPKESAEAVEETLGGSALIQRNIAAELARRLRCPWTPPFCKSENICWRGQPPVWHREGCSSVHGFQSYPIHSPHGLGDLTRKVPKELKSYYQKDLKLICSQVPHQYSLAASVLEQNAREVTAQNEWEAEWNSAGLASRLSEEEYRERKRQRLQKKIFDQLKDGVQKGQIPASTASADLTRLLNNMKERSGGKLKGSRFTHTEKLQFAQDEEKVTSQIGEGVSLDTEEEARKKREEELQTARDELSELSSKLEKLDIEIRKFSTGVKQMEEEKEVLQKQNKEKEDEYRVKKRTLDLLPDAANNISKLEGLVEASQARLVSLANQWDKHRIPLTEQYKELKALNEKKEESETEKLLEEIKEFRRKMKEIADETRGREDLYKQLIQEYERMAKDVNRTAYTKRIMEIVGNIKKQQEEINKVLIDTRSVQKEINQLSGKLDRTFLVTDELIFRDAKKDEAVRKAYKYLAALHENCDTLIKTVEETGVIMREIRELEDQIEHEGHKKVLANLEKITSDYQQMKKENSALIAKLKNS